MPSHQLNRRGHHPCNSIRCFPGDTILTSLNKVAEMMGAEDLELDEGCVRDATSELSDDDVVTRSFENWIGGHGSMCPSGLMW